MEFEGFDVVEENDVKESTRDNVPYVPVIQKQGWYFQDEIKINYEKDAFRTLKEKLERLKMRVTYLYYTQDYQATLETIEEIHRMKESFVKINPKIKDKMEKKLEKEVNVTKCRCLCRLKRFSEALTELSPIVSKYPTDADYLLMQSEVHLKLNSFNESKDTAFKCLLLQRGKSIIAWCILGISYFKLSLVHEALQCLSKAQMITKRSYNVGKWQQHKSDCHYLVELEQLAKEHQIEPLEPSKHDSDEMKRLQQILNMSGAEDETEDADDPRHL